MCTSSGSSSASMRWGRPVEGDSIGPRLMVPPVKAPGTMIEVCPSGLVPSHRQRPEGERQHVVEVRHDVIGILQHAVGTGIGDHDTGEPAGN
jgi:hypothetical protein